MKILLIIVLLIATIFVGYGLYLNNLLKTQNNHKPFIKKADSMTLTSSIFANNQPLPVQYTCDGKNINPPFDISTVSIFAKSLILIAEDPDSSSGNFTHWVLFNIDPATNNIFENSVPDGAVEGLNDFGKSEYGGPCPNSGTHHYVFTLYSLDTMLSLKRSATKLEVLNAMKNHIIEQSQLTGIYKRQ